MPRGEPEQESTGPWLSRQAVLQEVEMEQVWLLSEEGLLDLQGEPVQGAPFDGLPVTAGDIRGASIAVIVDGSEVWTSMGGKWERKSESALRLNCLCWTSEGKLLVGTAASRLAWVEEGSLSFIDTFDNLEERRLWSTPWGGPPDLRSLTVSPDRSIYANIHVGWIARSTDGGASWAHLSKGLEKDVHQVASHPTDPAIVFAATATGFHISLDRGESFVRRPAGMPYLYQRACACWAEGDVYLATTSRGPHGQADSILFRTENRGENWARVEGLPEKIDRNIDTYQLILEDGGTAWAVVDDRSLFRTEDRGKTWKLTGGDYPKLHSVMVVSS
jgi:hypothetical protein